jgi:hypothetical protein
MGKAEDRPAADVEEEYLAAVHCEQERAQELAEIRRVRTSRFLRHAHPIHTAAAALSRSL